MREVTKKRGKGSHARLIALTCAARITDLPDSNISDISSSDVSLISE